MYTYTYLYRYTSLFIYSIHSYTCFMSHVHISPRFIFTPAMWP